MERVAEIFLLGEAAVYSGTPRLYYLFMYSFFPKKNAVQFHLISDTDSAVDYSDMLESNLCALVMTVIKPHRAEKSR